MLSASLSQSSLPFHVVGSLNLSTLPVRIQRPREGKSFPQSYTVTKWQSVGLIPNLLPLKPKLLSVYHLFSRAFYCGVQSTSSGASITRFKSLFYHFNRYVILSKIINFSVLQYPLL